MPDEEYPVLKGVISQLHRDLCSTIERLTKEEKYEEVQALQEKLDGLKHFDDFFAKEDKVQYPEAERKKPDPMQRFATPPARPDLGQEMGPANSRKPTINVVVTGDHVIMELSGREVVTTRADWAAIMEVMQALHKAKWL